MRSLELWKALAEDRNFQTMHRRVDDFSVWGELFM